VALGRGNGVAEIDRRDFSVRRYLPAGSRDWGIGVAPDGQRLYAANGLSGDVSVIDLASGKTVATVKTGGKPWGVVVVP
jgi:YVTN family beta-propeller protein